jgi:hypothetical protein
MKNQMKMAKSVFCTVVLLLAVVPAYSVDVWWQDAFYSGEAWGNADGWKLLSGDSAWVPTSSDYARIKQNIVISTGTNAQAGQIFLSYGVADSILDVTGGSLATNYIQFGHSWGHGGTLNMSGGSIDVNGDVRVGFRCSGIKHSINITDGSFTANTLSVYEQGVDINLSGGDLTVNNGTSFAGAWSNKMVNFGDSASSTGRLI